jgi:hypothetical protein
LPVVMLSRSVVPVATGPVRAVVGASAAAALMVAYKFTLPVVAAVEPTLAALLLVIEFVSPAAVTVAVMLLTGTAGMVSVIVLFTLAPLARPNTAGNVTVVLVPLFEKVPPLLTYRLVYTPGITTVWVVLGATPGPRFCVSTLSVTEVPGAAEGGPVIVVVTSKFDELLIMAIAVLLAVLAPSLVLVFTEAAAATGLLGIVKRMVEVRLLPEASVAVEA